MKKFSNIVVVFVLLISLVACSIELESTQGDAEQDNSEVSNNLSENKNNQNEQLQTNAPNTYLPSIMINNTLYLLSGKEKSVIEINENDYIGKITSVVPLTQIPIENEQANIDIEGSPYAEYQNGIVVLWNEEWTLFVTETELLSE